MTETTPYKRITGEVLPDTLQTGVTEPFERTMNYRHDNFHSPRRQLDRFMAKTQEVAAA